MVSGLYGLYALELLKDEDYEGENGGFRPVLRPLDPDGAREVASVALPRLDDLPRDALGNPYPRSHELLGSSGDPLLYDRAEPGTAWCVHGAPLAMEQFPFPVLPEEATLQGFEHEGALLAWVHPAEGDFVARAGLEDDLWTEVDLDDEQAQGARIRAFSASAQGGVALLEEPDGLALAGLSYGGEVHWRWSLGCRTWDALQVSPLPDGRVLVPAWVQLNVFYAALFPLVLDPESGDLRAPERDCVATHYFLQGVSSGGREWMLHLPLREDGRTGPLELFEVRITGGLETGGAGLRTHVPTVSMLTPSREMP
jgi:hypothetical protein